MILLLVSLLALTICKPQSRRSLLIQSERQFAYQYLDCSVVPALRGCHESCVIRGQHSCVHVVDLARVRRSRSNNSRREILFAEHCTPTKVYNLLLLQRFAWA